MKTGLLSLILLLVAAELRAQESWPQVPADTLTRLANAKTKQLDSIRLAKFSRVDSTRAGVSNSLDSLTATVNHSIDSLNRLAMTTAELNQKMDTIYRRYLARLNGAILKKQTEKTDSLKLKVDNLRAQVDNRLGFLDSLRATGHFGDLSLPGEMQTKLKPLQIGSIQTSGLKLSTSSLGSVASPGLPAAPAVRASVPAIDQMDLPGSELVPKVKHMTGVASDYYKELQKLEEGNFDSLKLQTLMEQRIKEMDALSGLEEARNPFEEAHQNLSQLQGAGSNMDSLKQAAQAYVREELAGRFKDKGKSIDDGMAQLARYQEKFPSLADSRYVPKRRPNLMKDKPFRERIIPGVYFQVRTYPAAWKSIDLSPNVEYWITDRFRAGIGGTYQILANTNSFSFATNTRTLGFRAVANYKVIEGLFAHLQYEQVIQTDYQNFFQSGQMEQSSEWRGRFWLGATKPYGISKSVRGIIQLMVDPSDWSDIIQGRSVALRFGFEYQIHKRTKKRDKTTDTKD